MIQYQTSDHSRTKPYFINIDKNNSFEMKFLNKLSKKSPELKILQEIEKLDMNTPSIMFIDKLQKFDIELVFKVVQTEVDNGKINGKFIGNKGWFLFDAQDRLDEVWKNLNKGPINLGDISTKWGDLGNKRVFLAIEEFGKSKKLTEPIFTRKNELLFLNSCIMQKWNDAVNRFDNTKMEIQFDKIIENVDISHKEIVTEIIRMTLKSKNSVLLVGNDNIVRRRTETENYVSDFINTHMENKEEELYYSSIAEKFGLTEVEIAQVVLQLIENKLVENMTNYPTDGFLKKR